MTAHERTGWRDEAISRRHRTWGLNCPAVDLDFLMVEYNFGRPVALIEYKHYQAFPPNTGHPTYRALTELADTAGLPFLMAYYWPDIWAFRVEPLNHLAAESFGTGEALTERQFVTRLYRMRHFIISSELEARLLDEPVPHETA